MSAMLKIVWPNGKRFAFTVFDDTDYATVENVGRVYAFLADQGFRTTKSCWPLRGTGQGRCAGETCEEPHYLKWLQELQARGFEIGYHLATFHTSPRKEVIRSMEQFHECFGHDPRTTANHTGCDDSMYWGSHRLSGSRRLIYNLLTRFRNHNRYRGDVEGDDLYWGDVCRQRVRFFRNFTFPEINTLRCCPFMPYHDPERPCVNYWFASSDGHDVDQYVRCLSEPNQDRIEAEGGACIMYTHFASGFSNEGKLHGEFERLMKRLAQKNGWFVPVSTLLEFLLEQSGHHTITPAERWALEWKWLWGKIRMGGTT
jgi:hypothetical protein